MLGLSACSSTPTRTAVDMDANELLTNARSASEGGRFDEALKYYDQIEARYPYSVFSRQALLDQAYGYFQQSEEDKAIATLERFLKLYPNHAGTDYALYLKGLIHFSGRRSIIDFLVEASRSQRDLEASKNAYNAFNSLISRYPNSKYAEDAKAHIGLLFNQMGQYEVNLAKFYFERGAFVAAATRANLSLKNYPQAQAQEEALAILAACYRELGIKELFEDTTAILQRNYPHSTFNY